MNAYLEYKTALTTSFKEEIIHQLLMLLTPLLNIENIEYSTRLRSLIKLENDFLKAGKYLFSKIKYAKVNTF